MKPGDVVTHFRSGRRMTIESITGKVVACAWFHEGLLHRREFHIDFLRPEGMALA